MPATRNQPMHSITIVNPQTYLPAVLSGRQAADRSLNPIVPRAQRFGIWIYSKRKLTILRNLILKSFKFSNHQIQTGNNLHYEIESWKSREEERRFGIEFWIFEFTQHPNNLHHVISIFEFSNLLNLWIFWILNLWILNFEFIQHANNLHYEI